MTSNMPLAKALGLPSEHRPPSESRQVERNLIAALPLRVGSFRGGVSLAMMHLQRGWSPEFQSKETFIAEVVLETLAHHYKELGGVLRWSRRSMYQVLLRENWMHLERCTQRGFEFSIELEHDVYISRKVAWSKAKTMLHALDKALTRDEGVKNRFDAAYRYGVVRHLLQSAKFIRYIAFDLRIDHPSEKRFVGVSTTRVLQFTTVGGQPVEIKVVMWDLH